MSAPRQPLEAPEGAGALPKKEPRCVCGHTISHPLVSATGEYTIAGWMLIMIGISAAPKAIRYQCRKCDKVIARTSDPDVIRETRLWG